MTSTSAPSAPSSAAPLSDQRRFRARRVPREDGDCGWIVPLPPRTPTEPLEGDHRADAVVVGAGFTGLAAARTLARELGPDARILLLDAQAAGCGASSRSSGFVVDMAGFSVAMEPEDARRHVRLARHGIRTLGELVEEHAIDCHWDDTGWLHVAAGDAGMAELATLRTWLDGREEPYDWFDGAGMEAITGTAFYRAGLRLPGRPLVHAGALVRGLVEALPDGVELHEETPVLGFEAAEGHSPSSPRWRVRLGRWPGPEADRPEPAGSVLTPRVIVGVNGASPGLGLLGRRVFPLMTFGSMTRPLTAAEQESLGGEREWGVLAQDPMGSSLRRTRDQRLLVRNTVRFEPSLSATREVLDRARAIHLRVLRQRFPQLPDLPFEHTWAGNMGATPDRIHFFAAIAPGLHTAAGFTGAGIALGTTCGELLAQQALGIDSPLLRDAQALPGPRKLPPQPFLDLGIRWRVGRLNASAGPTP